MTGKLRTIFLGTPKFAVPILEALHRETEVVLVITQQDKKVGRGCKMCKPEIKVTAEQLGLEVIQPPIVKGRKFASRIAEYRPDFIVTAAFGRILGPSLLKVPQKAALNVHASLLPRHRGAAPANWAVLLGDSTSGVSIMEMVPELDAGPVYLKKEVAIDPSETACDLLARLSRLGAEALVEALANFDEISPVEQNHELATYARMLTKQDGKINWMQSAKEIANQIRGLAPWPSTFTSFEGITIKIHAGEALLEGSPSSPPGTVMCVSKQGIDVVCGSGILRIKELQAPGRKRLGCAQFLAGTSVNKGQQFEG